MGHIEILLIAIILDMLLGEPVWLWSRLPHPVKLIGDCISWFDKRFNQGGHRKIKGALVMTILIIIAGISGWIISVLPDMGIFEIIIVAVLLAHKSLIQHILNVKYALSGSLESGRQEVAKIVGRNTEHMQSTDVVRATIESVAENFSDGVIAPAFWYLILGVPGILIYKVVNTADSMIGYKTDKYLDFGFAAAKIDDIINWIPARLSALLITITNKPNTSWKIVQRDARLHRSPNAGWPETAMAAVLDIALAGPRFYEGQRVEYPFVNKSGRHYLTEQDIFRAAHKLNWVWGGIAFVLLLMVLF